MEASLEVSEILKGRGKNRLAKFLCWARARAASQGMEGQSSEGWNAVCIEKPSAGARQALQGKEDQLFAQQAALICVLSSSQVAPHGG